MKPKDRKFYNNVLIKERLKLCSSCEKIKSIDEYHINKRLQNGLQSACKSCIKKRYNSEQYKHKEAKRVIKYELNGSTQQVINRRKNKIQNAYNDFKETSHLKLINDNYKQIKQNHNFYVNEFGDIKKISCKSKRTKLKWSIENVYVTPNYYGYLRFNMNNQQWRVHQIVAQEFLGHIMCGHKLVVDHIDGNRLNNYYKNLQVVTNHENLMKGKYNATKEEKFLKYIKQIKR
mgnify:CR=1 FL=1